MEEEEERKERRRKKKEQEKCEKRSIGSSRRERSEAKSEKNNVKSDLKIIEIRGEGKSVGSKKKENGKTND